jgi:hypothetical protein
VTGPAIADTPPLRLAWHPAMAAIDLQAWDTLARQAPSPFLRWQWLHQLEVSQSVAPRTGWLPCHLTVHRGDRLVGGAALYLKRHSQGEFVFDQPWARLAQRLRVRYYPKLVGMVPFTPVAGYRFLMAAEEDQAELNTRMIGAIDALCRAEELGGCHLLHVDPEWAAQLGRFGFATWVHPAFIWRNRGFRDFSDYLDRFNSDQRRNIRRERRSMHAQGLHLEVLTAQQLDPAMAPRLYRFYSRTNDKFGPWGCKYLTEEFFHGIIDTFRQHLALVVATPRDGGDALGLSLLVVGDRRLYGRYWGSARDVPQLHFNACYYTPIEWAIAQGITSYDPGMGGLHKARRGFEAVPNISLHRLFDPGLQEIMAHYLAQINRAEQEQIAALNRAAPFRIDDGPQRSVITS